MSLLSAVTFAVAIFAASAFKATLPSSIFRSSRSLQMTAVQLTPDGGVVKETITKGQGKKIEAGDILAIEFAAYVKGSKTPFAQGNREKFIARDGSLIKGWDIAVDSMTVGEAAKFVCTAPYAYGSKGVAPVIAPNSDVEIQLTILAWLGNQLRPESLFQKDLDIDPFVASTPEAIQADFENMQVCHWQKIPFGVCFSQSLPRPINVSCRPQISCHRRRRQTISTLGVSLTSISTASRTFRLVSAAVTSSPLRVVKKLHGTSTPTLRFRQ
jgi:hypothetical protein